MLSLSFSYFCLLSFIIFKQSSAKYWPFSNLSFKKMSCIFFSLHRTLWTISGISLLLSWLAYTYLKPSPSSSQYHFYPNSVYQFFFWLWKLYDGSLLHYVSSKFWILVHRHLPMCTNNCSHLLALFFSKWRLTCFSYFTRISV